MYKTRAASLGAVAAFATLCGVLMAVLMYFLVDMLVEQGKKDSEHSLDSLKTIGSGLSLFGLMYIIPGVLAFLSALVQNKCLYIFSCIVSMVSLVIVGATFYFFGFVVMLYVFALGAISGACSDVGGVCSCRYDDGMPREVPFEACSALDTFFGLTVGLVIVLVLGWILLLVAFILCCYYACRPHPSSADSTGTILVPSQQPMIQHGEGHYQHGEGHYQQKA